MLLGGLVPEFHLGAMEFERLPRALMRSSLPRLKFAPHRNLFTASTSSPSALAILCRSVGRIVTTSNGLCARHKPVVPSFRYRKAKTPRFRRYSEGKQPRSRRLRRTASPRIHPAPKVLVLTRRVESRVLSKPTLRGTHTAQVTPVSILPL